MVLLLLRVTTSFNSLSRDHTITWRINVLPPHVAMLSTPSLGITQHVAELLGLRVYLGFQLPLSGSRVSLAVP